MVIVVCTAGCSPESGDKNDKSPESKESAASEVKPVLVELAAVRRGMIEEILERSAPLEAEAHV